MIDLCSDWKLELESEEWNNEKYKKKRIIFQKPNRS